MRGDLEGWNCPKGFAMACIGGEAARCGADCDGAPGSYGQMEATLAKNWFQK
jgi:hypothetical protein